jgi:hypothetical protein
MPVWLNRAGSNGEYEQEFIQENRGRKGVRYPFPP